MLQIRTFDHIHSLGRQGISAALVVGEESKVLGKISASLLTKRSLSRLLQAEEG